MQMGSKNYVVIVRIRWKISQRMLPKTMLLKADQ